MCFEIMAVFGIGRDMKLIVNVDKGWLLRSLIVFSMNSPQVPLNFTVGLFNIEL